MTDHVRFSLMWVNDPVTHQRPMSSCRMTLRDAGGDALGQSHGGLTCSALYLDQVHIQFRPETDIATGEFQAGDDATKPWLAETTELYVRTSPGRRSVCYTLGASDPVPDTPGHTVQPKVSLVYTAALSLVPDKGGLHGENVYNRTYRPLRDLPVATHLQNVSELTVDLLWPLLQADPRIASWYVPNYRIHRVLCEFSAHV